MTNSINTNSGALVALQNLGRVNESMQQTQGRISTGYKVASAFDDGASFAVAQGLRANVSALGAVNERLSVAKGLTSTTMAAMENVNGTLKDLKDTTIKLADESLDAESRTNYEKQFKALVDDVNQFINDASYNGTNLLKSGAEDVKVIANQAGDSITVGQRDLSAILTSLGRDATTGVVTAPAAEDYSATATYIDATATVGAATDTDTNGTIDAGEEGAGTLQINSADVKTGTEYKVQIGADKTASYVVKDGDTVDNIATGLAAAISGAGVTGISAAATTDTITINNTNLATVEVTSSVEYSAADASKAMLKTIDEARNTVSQAMNALASDDRRVANQVKFNSSISDAVTKGLGAIVDADLAKESANLQSLQVRQQLSTQALSIANQAPQSLLSLFR